MAKELFSVGSTPNITITNCAGDLVIRPWLKPDVRARGNFTVEEGKEQLAFDSSADLVLSVPEGASVYIENASGDTVLRSLTGDTAIESAAGDVVLGNLGVVKINHIAGDLVANNLSGSLSVQQVDGDLVAKNLDGDLQLGIINGDVAAHFVNGSVTFDEVAGDISVRSVNGEVLIGEGRRDANLRNLGGRCEIKSILGDVRLLGGLGPFDHAISAQGDMVVRWPLDAPLLLEASAAEIENWLPLLDVTEKDGTLSGRLGDGKTRLSISAGGRLVLKESLIVSKEWSTGFDQVFDFDFASELSNLGAKISTEVGEQVARVTAELESNFGPDFMQGMAEQFSRKAEAAAEKARKVAEAAVEREHQRSKASKAPAKSSDGVAEAQLKILKMVENGVISPEDASLLLEALEGD